MQKIAESQQTLRKAFLCIVHRSRNLVRNHAKHDFSWIAKGVAVKARNSYTLRDSRACLKNHSRNLHAPLCGIFHPNSVAVARYGALIRVKSPTNCDAHLAESLFQTRSSIEQLLFWQKKTAAFRKRKLQF